MITEEKIRLSVVTLSKNSQEIIDDCLKSVSDRAGE